MALGQDHPAWHTVASLLSEVQSHAIQFLYIYDSCRIKISSALFGEVTVDVQGVCSCDCEMDRVSPCSKPCTWCLSLSSLCSLTLCLSPLSPACIQQMMNNSYCSNQGDLVCGLCDCEEGRLVSTAASCM